MEKGSTTANVGSARLALDRLHACLMERRDALRHDRKAKVERHETMTNEVTAWVHTYEYYITLLNEAISALDGGEKR